MKEVERVGLGAGRDYLQGVTRQAISQLDGTLWVATEQGELIPVRATP